LVSDTLVSAINQLRCLKGDVFDMVTLTFAVFVTNALSFLSTLVSAQTRDNSTVTPAASTFYLPETETQFSVNIANDSSDVYLYFASPAYSWVGVGFGQKMDDSLMLIIYPNANGDSEFPLHHFSDTSLYTNVDRHNDITTHWQERWRTDLYQQGRD
jgi:hypothetical protein